MRREGRVPWRKVPRTANFPVGGTKRHTRKKHKSRPIGGLALQENASKKVKKLSKTPPFFAVFEICAFLLKFFLGQPESWPYFYAMISFATFTQSWWRVEGSLLLC